MDPNDGGQNDTTELVNESDAGIWYDLTSAPCFRESLLYAVGGGGAIGALNMLRNRDGMRAAETMVKTGCGIALVTWTVCRRRYYGEREMTYAGMELQRQKAAIMAAAAAKEMRGEKKE